MSDRPNATPSLSELADWECRRLAHWKLMRAAWEEWQRLVREHEELGFAGLHPGGPEYER
jgi:hypothetical protein